MLEPSLLSPLLSTWGGLGQASFLSSPPSLPPFLPFLLSSFLYFLDFKCWRTPGFSPLASSPLSAPGNLFQCFNIKYHIPISGPNLTLNLVLLYPLALRHLRGGVQKALQASQPDSLLSLLNLFLAFTILLAG